VAASSTPSVWGAPSVSSWRGPRPHSVDIGRPEQETPAAHGEGLWQRRQGCVFWQVGEPPGKCNRRHRGNSDTVAPCSFNWYQGHGPSDCRRCGGLFQKQIRECDVYVQKLLRASIHLFLHAEYVRRHPEPICVSRIAASLVGLPLSHLSVVLVGWKATVAILVAGCGGCCVTLNTVFSRPEPELETHLQRDSEPVRIISALLF
jgi:hypothetical protein